NFSRTLTTEQRYTIIPYTTLFRSIEEVKEQKMVEESKPVVSQPEPEVEEDIVEPEQPKKDNSKHNKSNNDEDNKKKRHKQNNNRSEEHTSELQSRFDLVCRLLLEK